MKVYPCGTEVTIQQCGVPAKVTAVCDRFGHISYEITYYVDLVRHTIWVDEKEINSATEKRIGFKK